MEGNIETAEQADKASSELVQQGKSELKQEWGEAYDKNLSASKHALAEFADEDFVKYLEDTDLGSHPSMIKIFHKIGLGMMGEEKLESGGGDVATPEQLDNEIKQIMALPAYWDEKSLERPELVRKVQSLLMRKHPESES
jgi:hypothetical protein